jgi:hypothetical protein
VKKLTSSEKIRRYMEAHPDATPKQIAEALGVRPNYVHVLRSKDKKRKAEGKPIRRVKNAYKKKPKLVEFLGVTMAKDDVTNLTPEQTARLLESIGKPKARMQRAEPQTIPEMIDKAVEARKEMSITMIEPKEDPVNHPAHYKVGGIETIDYIKAKLTPDEFRGYLKGNLLKYSSRIGHKGAAQVDAGKAGWYANALVQAIGSEA